MVDLGENATGQDVDVPPRAVPDRRSVLAAAFRRPGLRRLGLAFAGFRIAEMGAWIALTTVAYERGGVREASAVMVAQLAPATLFALCVSWLADRLGVRRVLVVGLAVQTAALVAMGALLVAGAPLLAVYGCAVICTIAVVTTLPTLSTLLPTVVGNPHELAAANSLVGWLDGAAVLLGPLITAAALAASGQAAPFFAFAVLTAGAGVAAHLAVPADRPTAVTAPPGGDHAPPGASAKPPWAAPRPAVGTDPMEGGPPGLDETLVDEVDQRRRARGVGPVLVAMGSWGFLVGALDLLYVVVAIDVTDGPSQRAALLNVAFGVGAVAGGTASALLIGVRRLWPFVTGAAVAAAGTLAILAVSGAVGSAAFAFGLCGVASAALFVSSRTLLHRVSDLRTLCRAFSLVEAASSAMLLLGALAVPLFVDVLGPQSAALAVGGVVALAVLVVTPNMARGERASVIPHERVSQLHAAELFSFLPAPTLETLAREARPLAVPAGTVVLRHGADGHRFYVVVSGSATVTRDGVELRRLGPGSGFGEMALLLDAPRSATVTTLTDMELLAVDRASFLVAVTGHDRTSEQAGQVLASYGSDAPTSPGGAG